MQTINIGDICTACGRDTGPASGLFVNRIGSGAEWSIDAGWDTQPEPFTVYVNGWLCADCQCVPCKLCTEPVLDYETVVIDGFEEWVHYECADQHGLEIQE